MINLLNPISRGKVTFRFFDRKSLYFIQFVDSFNCSFTYTLFILITIKYQNEEVTSSIVNLFPSYIILFVDSFDCS